ncbi:hypothetical protein [Candidatus Entotheonella palauensis]|uniref:Uncharacterized protein n=1 Tax=Candidatus Entotheonella gemina TaxID=1429439 RepID=W4MC29_9BACT|nr:hypothetical protein [Candidatus Entotheonella palauensis]ETX07745.1 MAG: hypothetical protein ETSY2_09445 [Candidatus Entotheonella gemina]
MFDERDIPDPARKFFDEFGARPDLTESPMMKLQAAGFKRYLELQLTMMKRYQNALNDQLCNDPMHDMMSQMAKKFMSNMIELNKFSKTYRRKVIEMQLEGLGQMIQMCEEFLSSMDSEYPPPENRPWETKEGA